MSIYIVCMSVTLWWIFVEIGIPFFRVVLPLMDSSAGVAEVHSLNQYSKGKRVNYGYSYD